MPRPSHYEEVEHTADVALRVWGDDLEMLLVHAAEGMFALMDCTRSKETNALMTRINLTARDEAMLLVEWLQELLYESERQQAEFLRFDLSIVGEYRLQAEVEGVTPCVPKRGIKAVTYSDLVVHCDAKGCETTITFDI